MKKSTSIVAVLLTISLALCSASTLWATDVGSATSAISQMTEKANAVADMAEKININTASTETLSQIPGLDSLASKITSYRDANGSFSGLTDLLNVDGINEALLEKITPFLTL